MKIDIEVEAPTPEEFEAYLVRRGWVHMVEPSTPNFKAFHSNELELEVPQHEEFWDYDKQALVLLKDLAYIENRPQIAVLRDVSLHCIISVLKSL
jgi:hypothetical protein